MTFKNTPQNQRRSPDVPGDVVVRGECDRCGTMSTLDANGRVCRDGCVPSKPAMNVGDMMKRRSAARTIAASRARARDRFATIVEDTMNTHERAYSYRLESDLREGLILAHKFQPIRFRLSFSKAGVSKGRRSAWYTPDFMVVLADGSIAMDEVKGHWEEAAKVRIRVVADLYPMFIFRTVHKTGRSFAIRNVSAT